MKEKKKERLTSTTGTCACAIHITCHQSTEGGKLNVDMNYEGDTYLAAYLLEDALTYIHQKIDEEALIDSPPLKVVK